MMRVQHLPTILKCDVQLQSGLTVGIVGGSDLVKISEQLGADGEHTNDR